MPVPKLKPKTVKGRETQPEMKVVPVFGEEQQPLILFVSFKELSMKIIEYATVGMRLSGKELRPAYETFRAGAVNPCGEIYEELFGIKKRYLKVFPKFDTVWRFLLPLFREASLIVFKREDYAVLTKEVNRDLPPPASHENYNLFFIDEEHGISSSTHSILTLADALGVSTERGKSYCTLVRISRYSPCYIRETPVSIVKNTATGEEIPANAIYEAVLMVRLFNSLLQLEKVPLERIKNPNPFLSI